jgi:hypothetical protein
MLLLEEGGGEDAGGGECGGERVTEVVKEGDGGKKESERWQRSWSGWRAGRDVALRQMLRWKVRYFTDGAAIGSRAFVDGLFEQCRERFGPKRKSGARKMRGRPQALRARRRRQAPGLALLLFTWEIMAPHSFYNGGSYLDTLSREATEHFLDITHDRYAEKCGDRIGGSIKGIFTDEPHRGFVMCDTHGQPGPVDTSWITSWTGRLPAEFQAAYGHDLLDKLPELFLRFEDCRETYRRVKWEYMELIQRHVPRQLGRNPCGTVAVNSGMTAHRPRAPRGLRLARRRCPAAR